MKQKDAVPGTRVITSDGPGTVKENPVAWHVARGYVLVAIDRPTKWIDGIVSEMLYQAKTIKIA